MTASLLRKSQLLSVMLVIHPEQVLGGHACCCFFGRRMNNITWSTVFSLRETCWDMLVFSTYKHIHKHTSGVWVTSGCLLTASFTPA